MTSDKSDKKRTGLGTFGGVFVPNVLTILGVIMYLRLGWVVGNSGLKSALIIIAVANVISLFTALSLSSIATNMSMKGGGAYYMISRSFGIEAGGGIGIPLYIAQTLGIGLYIVGFSESLCSLYPALNATLVGLSALAVIFIIALISSNFVIKIQYLILVMIVLSLVSFFTGKFPDLSTISMSSTYEEGQNFWTVFAVFFPAATGILSGISMSGDLEDPKKSIPAGTLLSVLITSVVYFSLAVWLSSVSSPKELLTNNKIMITLSRWSPLLYAGIWGATLSSAIVNLLAAPRTLQALASDGILFKFLRKGRGPQNEPVIGTAITFIFAIAVIMIGELNIIATVLTMFFLITYGSLNLIAFIEGVIKRPGYRPTFKVHWVIPMVGAIGSISVMFIINVAACLAGFSFVIILYVIIKRSQMKKNWGDIRMGFWSSVIQFALEKIETLTMHPQNWRPNILVFLKNNETKHHIAHLANALAKGRGFITFINLMDKNDFDTLNIEKNEIKDFLKEEQIKGFSSSAHTDNVFSGQLLTAQVHGIGKFKQNTIIMEWADSGNKWLFFQESELVKQFRIMRMYLELNMSLIFYRVSEKLEFKNNEDIYIWWDPTQDNGSLMLLLAHLMATSNEWQDSRIVIKSVVMKDKIDETKNLLEELVERSRIDAAIEVYFPDIKDKEKRYKHITGNVLSKRKKSKFINMTNSIVNIFFKGNSESLSDEITLDLHKEDEIEEKKNNEEEDENEIKNQISDLIQNDEKELIDNVIKEIIINNSQDANIVFLGFNLPAEGEEQTYINMMDALTAEMPSTLLINCPVKVDLFA